MKHCSRCFLVPVVVLGLTSFAWAEEVPSFSLDYAKGKATHIVVVDSDGVVLESWRGDLAKGDTVPFKADEKPLKVVNPFPKELRDPKVESVTGKRRVLFLIRGKPADSWTPAGFLLPEERFATVWVEDGQCFAIYQFTNPGSGANMHPLYLGEQRLKEEVLGGKKKAQGAKAGPDSGPFTNESAILAVTRDDQTESLKTKLLRKEVTATDAVNALTTYRVVTRDQYLEYAHQLGATGSVTITGRGTYLWDIEPGYAAVVTPPRGGGPVYLLHPDLKVPAAQGK
jgi:hypothetical protein